jgi:hypothetical protein
MNTFNDWHKEQNPNDILTLVAVSRKTYDKISTYQIIFYDRNIWNFYDGEQPVVLKGATECRISKFNNQYVYLGKLWERYIRLKKITCVNFREWSDIVYKLPLPKRHFHPNSVEAARPFHMCNRFNNVLIKGNYYCIDNPERLQIVKDIFKQANKIKLP